jgi:hypothetical protein
VCDKLDERVNARARMEMCIYRQVGDGYVTYIIVVGASERVPVQAPTVKEHQRHTRPRKDDESIVQSDDSHAT